MARSNHSNLSGADKFERRARRAARHRRTEARHRFAEAEQAWR